MLRDFIDTYLNLLALIGCASLWTGGWVAVVALSHSYGGMWWAIGSSWIALTLTVPAVVAFYKTRIN